MAIICLALGIFQIVVLAAIVLSWFPPGGEVLESARRFLHQSTDWALGPLRRAIPPVRLGAMALDLSPLILLFGISIIRGLIC